MDFRLVPSNSITRVREIFASREKIDRLTDANALLQGIASVLLLLSYGADVNAMADARHDYRTVLHYAILGGDPAVINLLLKQGARLDLGPDYQKPTALDLAILKGDPSIVEMLLEAGELRSRLRSPDTGIQPNRVAFEGRRVRVPNRRVDLHMTLSFLF